MSVQQGMLDIQMNAKRGRFRNVGCSVRSAESRVFCISLDKRFQMSPSSVKSASIPPRTEYPGGVGGTHPESFQAGGRTSLEDPFSAVSAENPEGKMDHPQSNKSSPVVQSES